MRAIWKGTLSFGLVTIFVEVYSAIQEHTLGFKLLHGVCHTPINYQRWCSHCNKLVDWADIVKGIKLDDGTYFILTPENLKKLKPEKTDTIEIIEFVDALAIDPIYYDDHYYVAPAKTSDKAYFLFTAALAHLNKVAIGKFVFKDKEYVGAIQPYMNGLLLTTLNYEYEIRPLQKLEELSPPEHMEARELKLAEQLITKLSKKKFDMSRFKDTFAEKLTEKIKKAAKGVVIPEVKKPTKKGLEQPSLMEALKASLASYESGTHAKRSR
jgi:DNA end-binding protein Ku